MRASLVLSAGLAVAIAGGVVGYVLARDPAKPPRRPAPSPAPAPVPPGKPMPAGCEVDAASPPVLALDGVPGDRLVLGPCKQGEVLERKVTVRNAGRGVLCVRDVETGCGCVKVRWEGDAHVPASGSGTLSIRVDTTNQVGVVEKWVTLYTNDPARPPGAVLHVSFEVRLGIVVGGERGGLGGGLHFGVHAPGEPATAVIRLTCPKDEPEWKVLSVESGAPEARRVRFAWEVVAAESKDPALRAYDLRLTHPGSKETGPDLQPLRITTTHPERSVILVDSDLMVVGKVYAVPTPVAFGFVRRTGPPPSRTVEIRPREPGAPFRVTGARIEGDGFAVGDPRRTAEGWAVDVRYDGKERPAGPVRATLVVATDDAQVPELRVPLDATLLGP